MKLMKLLNKKKLNDNSSRGFMDDKRIKEIVNDPNTWEWDGCTYNEANIDSSYLDDTFKEIFEKAEKLRKK